MHYWPQAGCLVSMGNQMHYWPQAESLVSMGNQMHYWPQAESLVSMGNNCPWIPGNQLEANNAFGHLKHHNCFITRLKYLSSEQGK